MRISLVSPAYPLRGGIAHYSTMLCRRLRQEHTVQFVSFARQFPAWLHPTGASDQDPSAEPLAIEGVERLIDTLNPLSWRRAGQAVRAFQPDLLVVAWWLAYMAPPMRAICRQARRCPGAEILFLCHNVADHETSRLKSALTRLAFAQADRFLTHSGEDRERLLALRPGARVALCHSPSYASLSPRRIDKAEAKARLGLSGPTILFFGHVRHYKGLGVLLRAMPPIRRRIPATLLVVGQFWKSERRELALIERLGIADCVQVRDEYVPNEDLPWIFGAADVAALPYRSASGSAVAQLALGFGRPVVATRVGSLPEVIEDGETGRIVPPGDSQALAEAILDALAPENLERYTANACRADERYTWDQLAQAVVSGETARP